MNWKYLKKVNDTCTILDHRLCPEVSAMFTAMASRMPAGGIEARYREVVDAVAKTIHDEKFPTLLVVDWTDKSDEKRETFYGEAEDLLTTYPLHPVVQAFFNKFVKAYGHSSILELTGQPAVYIEGVSWWTNWLLFDSPLCAGQEFSTRAVRRRDWPMCREAMQTATELTIAEDVDIDGQQAKKGDKLILTVPHPELQELHEAWMEIFEAEVEAWKEEFSKPCPVCKSELELPPPETLTALGVSMEFLEGGGCLYCGDTGKKHPSADSEPFRPALDKARWALPGTIATGCCHTTNLRERARVLDTGWAVARIGNGCGEAKAVWVDIGGAYHDALPGMSGMGLKEAWYLQGEESEGTPPYHLYTSHDYYVGDEAPQEVEMKVTNHIIGQELESIGRKSPRTYLDPLWNQTRMRLTIRCSLAAARDWHRHRTAYPWDLKLQMVTRKISEELFHIVLHPAYSPISELGKEKTPALLARSQEVAEAFAAAGDYYRMMLCFPLGTQVPMSCEMGLRDAVYMLELRANAPGANFEYRIQAEKALELLKIWLGPRIRDELWPWEKDKYSYSEEEK